jgi:prevent-host-death family protein
MKTVGIHEAKTNFSRLIEKACRGEEIIIARGKDPLVRLVPIAGRRGRRKLGILKGKLVVGPEFFEPLPPEEISSWQFSVPTPRRSP